MVDVHTTMKYKSGELDRKEYYEYEDKDRLIDLKVKYERALAAKDRLQEYLDDLYDDFN